MAFMLEPEQQAGTYDRGYFYPGPVTRRAAVRRPGREPGGGAREYGRPEYDRWIAERPFETPLTPDRLVAAFRRWDEQIGAKANR